MTAPEAQNMTLSTRKKFLWREDCVEVGIKIFNTTEQKRKDWKARSEFKKNLKGSRSLTSSRFLIIIQSVSTSLSACQMIALSPTARAAQQLGERRVMWPHRKSHNARKWKQWSQFDLLKSPHQLNEVGETLRQQIWLV